MLNGYSDMINGAMSGDTSALENYTNQMGSTLNIFNKFSNLFSNGSHNLIVIIATIIIVIMIFIFMVRLFKNIIITKHNKNKKKINENQYQFTWTNEQPGMQENNISNNNQLNYIEKQPKDSKNINKQPSILDYQEESRPKIRK